MVQKKVVMIKETNETEMIKVTTERVLPEAV